MLRILFAGAAAILVMIALGIVGAFVLSDAAASLTERFSPALSFAQRFALHLSERAGMGIALTALTALSLPGGRGAGRFLAVSTAAWFLGYVPGFLMLTDIGVLPLQSALLAIGWGWIEIVSAGGAAWLILRGGRS
jgi:hypothetical protein